MRRQSLKTSRQLASDSLRQNSTPLRHPVFRKSLRWDLAPPPLEDPYGGTSDGNDVLHQFATQKEGPHIACSCSSCASIVPAVNMTLNEPPARALHGCHDELHVLFTRGIRVRPCALSCARPRVATVACQTRAGSSTSRREARVVVALFRLWHPRDPSRRRCRVDPCVHSTLRRCLALCWW